MHLASGQTVNRLKAFKVAWEHYHKHRGFYVICAQSSRGLAKQFKQLELNIESRIAVTAAIILQSDPHLYALALANTQMNASDLAEAFARLTVEHEDGR
jgi:hypothetical protein